MSEIELKPCPLCGGKAKMNVCDGGAGHSVYCFHCHCEGPYVKERHCNYVGESRVVAAKEWNRRPIEDALRDRIKELEQIIDDDIEFAEEFL